MIATAFERLRLRTFGCMGMRTFTEIPKDHLLSVVPGNKVEEFARTLKAMRETNDTMAAFYASRKKGFSSPVIGGEYLYRPAPAVKSLGVCRRGNKGERRPQAA